MNIIKTNIDPTDKKAVYRLTKSESMQIQKVERGTSIPVERYALYEEENSKGEFQNVLAFTSGGMKFSTISKTFIRSFMECVDLMENDPFSIIVTGGETKSGRGFVNCELDCD